MRHISLNELLPWTTASTLAVSALAISVGAQQTTTNSVTAPWQKPAWLIDLSLGVRESYDNNLFYSDVGSLANKAAWITTVAPKIGVNFAPLLGDQKTLQVLSLGYAPDFNIFHEHSEESFDAHRTAATLKGKTDAFALNVENGFNFVDGTEAGPRYSEGRSAFATAAVRERRQQFQDRAKFSLQYDQEQWFARPVASLLYYDLMTRDRAPVGPWKGYDNYADRYDVNGGIDFGYKLQPQLALTLGYRYGHQYQEQYSATVDPEHLSSPSDYQRVLLGVEGKPCKMLTVALQAGPDFRVYELDTPTHTTPVNDKHPVKYYGEANLTAELSSRDTLAFKYKQWQWVASTGKLPYFDSNYELSYRRKVTAQLSLDLTGRLASWDYTSGNIKSSLRDDRQYTVSAGAAYAFTTHFSVNAAYTIDLGRNAQAGLSPAVVAAREFDHQLISLGALYKF